MVRRPIHWRGPQKMYAIQHLPEGSPIDSLGLKRQSSPGKPASQKPDLAKRDLRGVYPIIEYRLPVIRLSTGPSSAQFIESPITANVSEIICFSRQFYALE